MLPFGPFWSLPILALVIGCAAPGAGGGGSPATPPEDACGASTLQGLVGQVYSPDMAPERDPQVRVIRPDTVVTMDFRADRLNIILDENDVVTDVRCQ